MHQSMYQTNPELFEIANDFYKPEAFDAFGNTLDEGDHVLVWTEDEGFQRARVTRFGKGKMYFTTQPAAFATMEVPERSTVVYGRSARRAVKIVAPEAN